MEGLIFTLLFVSATSILGWVAKIVYSFWWRPKQLERWLKQQGIVGPRYEFPYGNVKEEVRLLKEARSKPMERSHRIVPRVAPFIHETVNKYGKMSVTWFGKNPRVTIMEPDVVRDVFSNKSGNIQKPKRSRLLRLLVPGLADHEGEKWAKHRRLINPAFHTEKLKRMFPAFSASCRDLIAKWESLAGDGSIELDIWPELQKLTGDVISRTAFGSNYKEGNRIFQLQVELSQLIIEAFQSGVDLPGFRFLPTKRNLRIKEIDREVRALLTNIIKKKEKAMKLGEAVADDLLGLLLESNSKDSQGGSKGLTTEEVMEECKLFYFAGQETTSVLLTWTLIVLSMDQNWQTRAREEVLQVFGKNKPNFDGLSKCKIVTMILYEVLRLYPPAVNLFRTSSKKAAIGGVSFIPGVQLSLPVLLLHHDQEMWGEDAEEFKPERFSEGISKASPNQAFFPFGWGPRICVGQNFALTEAKLALAMILQHFSVELSPTYVHAPLTVITLQPQYGAQIILHRL